MVRRCKKTLTDDNIQKEMRARSHKGVKTSGTRNYQFVKQVPLSTTHTATVCPVTSGCLCFALYTNAVNYPERHIVVRSHVMWLTHCCRRHKQCWRENPHTDVNPGITTLRLKPPLNLRFRFMTCETGVLRCCCNSIAFCPSAVPPAAHLPTD